MLPPSPSRQTPSPRVILPRALGDGEVGETGVRSSGADGPAQRRLGAGRTRRAPPRGRPAVVGRGGGGGGGGQRHGAGVRPGRGPGGAHPAQPRRRRAAGRGGRPGRRRVLRLPERDDAAGGAHDAREAQAAARARRARRRRRRRGRRGRARGLAVAHLGLVWPARGGWTAARWRAGSSVLSRERLDGCRDMKQRDPFPC